MSTGRTTHENVGHSLRLTATRCSVRPTTPTVKFTVPCAQGATR
jgi:hypothetical protein